MKCPEHQYLSVYYSSEGIQTYIGVQIRCHRNHSVGIGHIIRTQQNPPRFLNRYASRKLQSRYHFTYEYTPEQVRRHKRQIHCYTKCRQLDRK